MQNHETNPVSFMMKLILSRWITKPIAIVSEMEIPEIIGNSEMKISDIADKTGSNEQYLYRIFRALCSVGIFDEVSQGVFVNNDLSRTLSQDSLGSMAVLFNSEWNDIAYSKALESVTKGTTAFDLAYGKPLFEWLEHNSYALKYFTKANEIKIRQRAMKLAGDFDFSKYRKILDIGGGNGQLLSEIIIKFPKIHCEVLETPEMVDFIEKTGGKSNIKFTNGNFFENIPTDFDVYIMSDILHDWSDQKAAQILVNCSKAMNNSSLLLVVENIIPDGNEPSIAKLLDIEMMFITGGRERTLSEFNNLFEKAELRKKSILNTQEGVSIMVLEKN